MSQEELAAYVTEQAYRMGVPPDRLAKELAERGQLAAVAADVLRGKALTLLAERAKVTDESGHEVDLTPAVEEVPDDAEDAAEEVSDDAEDSAEPAADDDDSDAGEDPQPAS